MQGCLPIASIAAHSDGITSPGHVAAPTSRASGCASPTVCKALPPSANQTLPLLTMLAQLQLNS